MPKAASSVVAFGVEDGQEILKYKSGVAPSRTG